jgi:uncharacterized protein GlcG (DUF336 family)
VIPGIFDPQSDKEDYTMSRRWTKTLVVVTLIVCFLGMEAQMLPYPYGAPISNENAKKAAAAALAEATKNHWVMAVAVVDPSGTLVYYEKTDNTQIGSAEVSIAKARSAALYKRPTKAFQDALAQGGAGLRILGLQGAVPVEGGVPIVVDGKDGKMVIGAIGVSGDTSDHDGVCATAGAAAIK